MLHGIYFCIPVYYRFFYSEENNCISYLIRYFQISGDTKQFLVELVRMKIPNYFEVPIEGNKHPSPKVC